MMDNTYKRSRLAADAVLHALRKAGIEVVVATSETLLSLNEDYDRVRLNIVKNRIEKLKAISNTIIDKITTGGYFHKIDIELPDRTKNMVFKVNNSRNLIHKISIEGIRHGLKNHGIDGRKLEKGDIPIKKEYTALIPYILTAPDKVIKGSTDITGRESIKFLKSLSNGLVIVVEKESLKNPQIMETINMWATLSDVPDAQHKVVPMDHVQNVIISKSDIAKIIKDAETAIENDIKPMKKPDGLVYGWTYGDKIYLTPEGLNPETPIHEYTHLWANAMRTANPEGWDDVKGLLLGKDVTKDILKDDDYAHVHEDEDELAGEALARISGSQNAERLIVTADILLKKNEALGKRTTSGQMVARLRRALDLLWNWVEKTLFNHIRFTSQSMMTERVLFDLLDGTDLGIHGLNPSLNLHLNMNNIKMDVTNMKQKGKEGLERISSVTVRPVNRGYNIRCMIDGEQQMDKRMKEADVDAMYRKVNLNEIAWRCFQKELKQSVENPKSLKR